MCRDGKGGEISLHLLTLMSKECCRKCEGIRKEVQEKKEHAWREKGTFQTLRYKSWAWQQISYSQSTCPDRHSNSMQYSSTHVLPTHPPTSLPYPPELFDRYLFIVIATEARILAWAHLETQKQIRHCKDEWTQLKRISWQMQSCHVQMSIFDCPL